jgi:hypothetical protein
MLSMLMICLLPGDLSYMGDPVAEFLNQISRFSNAQLKAIAIFWKYMRERYPVEFPADLADLTPDLLGVLWGMLMYAFRYKREWASFRQSQPEQGRINGRLFERCYVTGTNRMLDLKDGELGVAVYFTKDNSTFWIFLCADTGPNCRTTVPLLEASVMTVHVTPQAK